MSNFFEFYMSPFALIPLVLAPFIGISLARKATTGKSALFLLGAIVSCIIDIARFILSDMCSTYLVGAAIGLVLYLTIVFTSNNITVKNDIRKRAEENAKNKNN